MLLIFFKQIWHILHYYDYQKPLQFQWFEGSWWGAGLVVCKDDPPLSIVGGNTARIIMYREKEQYYKLKAEGKFD